MTSKSSYTKTSKKTIVQDTELVPVRSNIFYGIETKKLIEKKKTSERNLSVTPNITLYDSNSKAMIDFSDNKNNPDKSDVKSFFDLISPGFNFTLSNASWKNLSSAKDTFDLSGTYTFTKIIDSIVFATLGSGHKLSTKITRYDKEYFLNLPVFEFSSIVTKNKKEVKSYIINSLGKNTKSSFYYLGVVAGDYIQIQNNKQKYKIDSLDIDAEGKEIIVVEGEVTESSNIGTPILITIFQENKNKISIGDFNNEILGKTEIYQNNVIINCIDNTTELQSKLRENYIEKITSKHTANAFCNIINEIPTNNTEQLNTIRNRLLTRQQQSTISSQNIVLSTDQLFNTLFT